MKRNLFPRGVICVIALTLVSLLLFVSCASPSTSSPAKTTSSAPPPSTSAAATKPASSPAAPQTTAPATAPAPASSAKPTTASQKQTGGILKIMMPASPGSPIGWPVDGKGYIPQYAVSACLEGLIDRDYAGNLTPWLATAWQVAPDKKSLTLTLRKGVKFHDGSEFNAKAVKFNLDAFMTAKNAVTTTWDSVNIADDYTIKINLKSFENTMPSDISNLRMVSQAAFEKNGIEWARWNPVGTGPFQFVSFERDVKAVFKKFPNYWQEGKPYLDGVEMLFVVDPMTQSLAFQSGSAHVLALASGKIAAELKAQKYEVVVAGNGGVRSLLFDSVNADSPFADKKVRQAVMYAIDREAIAKALGRGFWFPMNQICFQGTAAYLPEMEGQYKFDPAKAKQLLAEAGFPNGFKYKITPTADPEGMEPMVSVQRYLSDVGIKIDLDIVDYAKFNQIRYSESGWKGGALMDMITPTSGGSFAAFARSYFSDKPADYISVKRPAGYWDAINEALATTDPQTEKTLSQKVHKIMTDDVMYAPIFGVGFQFPIKGVHDADFLYTGFYPGWHPANVWLDK
jgi:peptide/nickel transport system substrate-binding protein